MSHQFKPGDRAMIIGANSLTQNIGKVCELRELVTKGGRYIAPNGVMYQHEDEPCWTLVGDDLAAIIEDEIVFIGFGVHEPRHLMPLRGDFSPEQQKAKEVDPCA